MKVLAVFAHPDDEILIAPLLSRLSREGIDVKIVFATDGAAGNSGGEQDDELAKRRRNESVFAANEIGVAEPIFLDLDDGFSIKGKHFYESVEINTKLRKSLFNLFNSTQAEIVFTHGPEGVYGHPDHLLLSNCCTAEFQAGHSQGQLYYPGLSMKFVKFGSESLCC